MKTWKSKLWVKLTAAVLLFVFLVIFLGSICAVLVLANSDAYVDGGKHLREQSMASYLCYQGETVRSYLELKLSGDVSAREYADEYAERLAVEQTNYRCTVTDDKGNVVFQNAPCENTLGKYESTALLCDYRNEKTLFSAFSSEESFDVCIERLSQKYAVTETEWDGSTGTISYCERREYRIQGTIDAELPVNDEIALRLSWLDRMISMRNLLIVVMIFSALFSLILIVLLCSTAGHRKNKPGIHRNWIDRIPLELYLAAWGALLFLALALAIEAFESAAVVIRLLTAGAMGVLCYLLGLSFLMTMATRIKYGKWWRNTLVFRILHWLKPALCWVGRAFSALWRWIPLYWKAGLLWIGLSVVEFLFLCVDAFAALWVMEKLLLTPLLVLTVVNLRGLQKGAEKIGAGDLHYQVDLRHMLPTLREHGEQLNSISEGMQRAVARQMRSERMKSELITNVSHDIKTPLTSIVNYIDLLKKEGLDSAHAPEYLEVLERQSARLKKLTEDLIEASKAATGNMAVTLEPTDIGVLLSQAVGEYEEKFRRSHLEPVVSIAEKTPLVNADGRLLWRVFDNLLGNACKYALAETRIYLQVEVTDRAVAVLFKNISKQALNIPAEELMERFVRGDASRNTEGSGLGLSIAKSLTELQGGTFTLDIDGDLFKVKVSLPLA